MRTGSLGGSSRGGIRRILDVAKIVYLSAESCFLVAWLISLMVVQSRLAGILDGYAARSAHLLIGIHFLIPTAAIALSFDRADPDQELSILYFIAFFAVFGFDYYSITENVWSLHVPAGHEEIHTLEIALASIAIGLTSFWLLWYGISYSIGRFSEKKSRRTSDNDRGDEENKNTPLLSDAETSQMIRSIFCDPQIQRSKSK
jgi:hypothetical protein